MMESTSSRFAIPSTLQDLEREPHCLDPYPDDFQTDDPHGSFERLVQLVESGNQALRFVLAGGDNTEEAQSTILEEEEDEEGDEFRGDDEDEEGSAGNRAVPTEKPFIEPNRFQALYTLVRYVVVIALRMPTREAVFGMPDTHWIFAFTCAFLVCVVV